MDILRSPSHEEKFSPKSQQKEGSSGKNGGVTWAYTAKRLVKMLIIQPTIRFLLGVAFGVTVTVTICFFPFPKGKFFSIACAPLTLMFAHFLNKYTNTSVCMPTTAIQILQRKASFSAAWIVYLGMYFGSSYIIDQFHHAIETSPPKDREHMTLIVEKLYFSMEETVSGRLQQTAIVTAFFYGLDHTLIRVVLHVMSLVWLILLPEMNPAIAMGFFNGTKKLNGEDRARFWVNFAFLVFFSMVFIKLSDFILHAVKRFRSKSKEE